MKISTSAYKVCTGCNVSKPVAEYNRKTRSVSGEVTIQSKCRDCTKLERNTPEFRLAQCGRDLRKYGMTLDDYANKFDSQNGECPICKKVGRSLLDRSDEAIPVLMVDHDHATGHVRGLLHFTCNTMLGFFKDDPSLLIKAAEYLERHQSAT